MPHGSVRATFDAPAARVFETIHDYKRRLEWDTLLREAFLSDGFALAQCGAVAVCRGRRRLGGLTLETVYVTFEPGRVAAVRMINRPAFFESFAATIRHEEVADDCSKVEYKFNFSARPRWLQWLLHPVMVRVFSWETKRRLAALGEYLRR